MGPDSFPTTESHKFIIWIISDIVLLCVKATLSELIIFFGKSFKKCNLDGEKLIYIFIS